MASFIKVLRNNGVIKISLTTLTEIYLCVSCPTVALFFTKKSTIMDLREKQGKCFTSMFVEDMLSPTQIVTYF